ncbi:hypothetical protein FRC09_009416 [Ceratobasidium sp. 395]|nr:hypothetical protein FRC09_009416 [Ceratobasidium sp. 395]
MVEYSDTQVSDFVEIQQCCALENEDLLLTKAGELLDASKKTPHVHTSSQDPKGIAKDALGVMQAFDDISGELALTGDTASKNQWDNNYRKYQSMLGETVKLAELGSKYIQGFYDTVVSRFGKDDVDWEKDKNLIADFVKANNGQEIVNRTAQASQKFTDLKNDTYSFQSQFAAAADRKGQAYSSQLKQMNTERKNLQARLDSNRSSAAQIQNSMNRTAGPGFLLGWIVRGVLSLLGIGTFNMAGGRLAALQQEEQGLMRDKAALDQRAGALAQKESYLAQTRYAVAVLADDVSDISGRLDSLAQTWAVAHANFVALGELLQSVNESASRTSFMRRMDLISKSTSTLLSDMSAYKNAIAPGGNLVRPVKKAAKYDISRIYGWSDMGGGAANFDDTRPDLNPDSPIATIYVASGWVVDAIHVVYRLKNGSTLRRDHGPNRGASQINIGATEYVSAVWGRSGRADNGESWMGDCIQQIHFEITNSTNGAKRTAGPYGSAFKLSAPATTNINWRGRLLCLAGAANNGASQVGVRGLKFIQLKS